MNLSYIGCAIVAEAKARQLRLRRLAAGAGHPRWQLWLRGERYLLGYAEACRQASARLAQL